MIVLYSTGCPKCKVLEKGLEAKNVAYTLIEDEDEIVKQGFSAVPVLVVDDKVMHYPEAFRFLKQYKKDGATI